MSRWRVRWVGVKHAGYWIAYTPEQSFNEHTRFDTWQEAIDYADRKARTIEVTLPRYGFATPSFFIIRRLDGERILILKQNGSGHVDMSASEAEALALAILRQTRKPTHNPKDTAIL